MKTFMQFKTTLKKKEKSKAEVIKLPTSVDYFDYLVEKETLLIQHD